MSWTTEAKQVLKLASAGLTGLEIIGDLIAPILEGGAAKFDADVLAMIRTIHAIVDTVKSGTVGNVSTEQVEDALSALRSKIASNDRATQNEIDAKFPT